MQRTDEQQGFISGILAKIKAGLLAHSCLDAKAGTGKSTTAVEFVDEYVKVFPSHNIMIVCFGKEASLDVGKKLKEHGHTNWLTVQASTIHAACFSTFSRLFNPKVDNKKVYNLINQQNDIVYQEHAANIAQLVHLAKIEGFGFFPDRQINDTSAWYWLINHYDINGFDDTTQTDDVVACAQFIYKASLAQTDVVDFDDMVLFPLVKNIKVKFQKDLIINDEAQDNGRTKTAMLRKFLKPTGTFIAIGDPDQAIFGFAGAQSDALQQLIDTFQMEIYPLTVCWRCSKAVIRRAQTLVPSIKHADDAIEGGDRTLTELPTKELTNKDAILCRNTAPLIDTAYKLLRAGIACKVEGREIGTNLLRMINRWKRVTTIDQFLKKLDDFREREVQKALAKGHDSKVEEINDRCETLVHIANVCIDRKQSDLSDMRKFVEDMFSDKVKEQGLLTLATYHRSKGREWTNTYLLDHAKRCPSKYARQAWQKEQERHLAYVAFTRAMDTINFVNTQ